MPGISFEFEPVSKKKTLEKLDKKTIKEPLAKAIRDIVLFLSRTIKMSTPVDTARLRASVGGGEYKGGSYPEGYGIIIKPDMGKIGTNVEYASFVEYGTAKMEARYVTPGTSQRVKGKGPFTYSMEQLQAKIGEFLGELAEAIKVRFG